LLLGQALYHPAMTEPTVASTAQSTPAEQEVSFWEDLIDVFFEPVSVFRRRANASFWPPLAVAAVLMAVFSIANANVLQPILEAEMSRQVAATMKQNPQLTPERLEQMRPMMEKVQTAIRYGTVVAVPIFAFLIALVSWLVGKLFASEQTFQAAMMVVAYATLPRVIEQLAIVVQGLTMDASNLTAMSKVQINAARFLDPDATNRLLFALAARLDLFVIWGWVLIAIGLYVTGKVSRTQAVAFGMLMWVLASLPTLRNAYMAM
jgi:hypothetical protein